MKFIKKVISRIWWKLYREKAYYKSYTKEASESLRIWYQIAEENGLVEEFWRRRKVESTES